jgi:hypothetical protein
MCYFGKLGYSKRDEYTRSYVLRLNVFELTEAVAAGRGVIRITGAH